MTLRQLFAVHRIAFTSIIEPQIVKTFHVTIGSSEKRVEAAER